MSNQELPTFANAHFFFEGAMVFIVNSDNPEERVSVRDVVNHATSDVEGTMDQWREEVAKGNVSLRFGNEFFIKGLSNAARSAMNVRMHRIMVNVYDGILATGIKPEMMNYSVGYNTGQGQNKVFKPSLCIFFNKPGFSQTAGTAPKVKTTDELATEAISLGADPDEVMAAIEKYSKVESILRGVLGRFIMSSKNGETKTQSKASQSESTAAQGEAAESSLPI